MANKKIKRYRIRTPDGTVLESESVHHFVSHTDKNGEWYFVDGGKHYVRVGGPPDFELLTEYEEAE